MTDKPSNSGESGSYNGQIPAGGGGLPFRSELAPWAYRPEEASWEDEGTPLLPTEKIRELCINGAPTGEPYRTQAGERLDRWFATELQKARAEVGQVVEGILNRHATGSPTAQMVVAEVRGVLRAGGAS